MPREAIVCDGDGARVCLRRGPLRLDYDLHTGLYTIAYGDACAIEAAAASFAADGRSVATTSSFPHRWRVVNCKDQLGRGKELLITPAESPDPVRWSLAFSVYDSLDAVAIGAAIENGGADEIELRELRPLATSAQGRLRLGRALKTSRLLPNAWERASAELGVRQIEPGFACVSPISFVLVDTAHETALACGGLGPAKSFASFRIELIASKPPAYRLDALQETPVGCSKTTGVTIQPGTSFAPERLLLVFDRDGHSAFEQYAQCAGRSVGKPGKSGPGAKRSEPTAACGWSSWPYYQANITEAEVLRNVEFLAKTLKPYGLETIGVDAGWQQRGNVSGGPWKAGEHFPHGIAWLTKQIREHGFRPSLWIRPLEVDGMRLDPSSPFTHTTLRNEVGRLVTKGSVAALTIDCLDDDAFRRGDSFLPDDETITAIEALRRTVTAIRDGAGEACALHASNLTFGVGLGLVDSNRTGHDISAKSWRTIKEHGVKGIAARYALHGAWWHNNPGAAVVRPPLTLGEARTWASLCALTGGMTVAGDRMYALPPERLNVLKRVMPAVGVSARPVDLFEHELPEVWDLAVEAGAARWHVVGLFNWNTTPREIKTTRKQAIEQNVRRLRANDAAERELPVRQRRSRPELERIASSNRLIRQENKRLLAVMGRNPLGGPRLELIEPLQPMRPSARFRNLMLRFDQLGLEPAQGYLVYDFWDDRFLGLHGDHLKVLVRLADCVVLAVHPARGVPQLVSTNRHVTQGGVDLERIEWKASSCELVGVSRVVENDVYVATIYVPREFEFIGTEAGIADVQTRHDTPETVRLILRSLTSKPVRWKLKFNRARRS